MNSIELDRVRRNTSVATNERIDLGIEQVVAEYADASAQEISERIDELEREWDIERWLETHASIIALSGVGLAVTRDRRWLGLTAGVLGFLLLHGVHGWCPPLPVLRRFGVRTRGEIDRERFALRFLRGDFDEVREAKGRARVRKLIEALT